MALEKMLIALSKLARCVPTRQQRSLTPASSLEQGAMHMWQTEVHFPPAQVRSEPLDVQQLVSSPDARRRASAEAGSMTELLWKVEGKMRPLSADRRCVSGLESACNAVALRSLAQVIR